MNAFWLLDLLDSSDDEDAVIPERNKPAANVKANASTVVPSANDPAANDPAANVPALDADPKSDAMMLQRALQRLFDASLEDVEHKSDQPRSPRPSTPNPGSPVAASTTTGSLAQFLAGRLSGTASSVAGAVTGAASTVASAAVGATSGLASGASTIASGVAAKLLSDRPNVPHDRTHIARTQVVQYPGGSDPSMVDIHTTVDAKDTHPWRTASNRFDRGVWELVDSAGRTDAAPVLVAERTVTVNGNGGVEMNNDR